MGVPCCFFAHTKMDGSGQLYTPQKGHMDDSLNDNNPDQIHRREELYASFVANLYEVMAADGNTPLANVDETISALIGAVQRGKDDATSVSSEVFVSPATSGFMNVNAQFVTTTTIDNDKAADNAITETSTLVQDRAEGIFQDLKTGENVSALPEENKLNHMFEVKSLKNDLTGFAIITQDLDDGKIKGTFNLQQANEMITTLPNDAKKAIELLTEAKKATEKKQEEKMVDPDEGDKEEKKGKAKNKPPAKKDGKSEPVR